METMAQSRKPWWKGPLCTGGLLILVGIILFGGFTFALEATNSQEFCVSCHSMKGNFEEYKKTPHFRNPSGVQARCPDCHVPRKYGDKLVAKMLAAKDVYHEILGTVDTPEKFEAHRWEMASRVWTRMKETDSRECRSCHDFENMDLENQSRTANRKHSKAKQGGKTCIECHAGIAHKQPDVPPGAILPWETAEKESAGQN
jgi:cytochrome c-type protein NapC